MTTTKIWECKIGEVDSVAGGADYPMRQAVAAAYREVTGSEPVFIFSGWGALLTEAERAVVENRLPAPATAPEQCWCDEQGIGKPGVSCGDCPTRDYKTTAPEQPSKIDPTGSEPHSKQADQAEVTSTGQVSATAPEQCGHCGRRVIDAPWPVRDTTPEQPSWQDAPTEPGMWACLYMGELSTAIFNAYEIEHFDRDEMVGCRWRFIPEDKQ